MLIFFEFVQHERVAARARAFIKVAPTGKRPREIARDDEISEDTATDLARVTTTRFPNNEGARLEAQKDLLAQTEDLPTKTRHAVIQNYGKAARTESIAKIKEQTLRNTRYNISASLSAEIKTAMDRFIHDNGKDTSTAVRMLILEGLKHYGYMTQ